MGRVFKTTLSILGALAITAAVQGPLAAQEYSDPAAAQDERLSPRELDSLLAPVALYPDQLLAPILMAATYPHDVEAAADWTSTAVNARLRGDALAFAIEPFEWDPSIKTLAQFPEILRMMDDEWDWMVRVGNAFYLQESDVMDSVQRLRHQAYAMGTLRSTDLQRVRFESGAVIIDMVDPAVVYVPAYDPLRVYGFWSYPDFQPYYFHRRVTVTRYAIVPSLWGWSSWEWHRHRIRVDLPRYRTFNRGAPWRFNDDTWRHDRSRSRWANVRRDDGRRDWRDNTPRRADGVHRRFEENHRIEGQGRIHERSREQVGRGEARQFRPDRRPRERQAYAGPQLTPPTPITPMAPQVNRNQHRRDFQAPGGLRGNPENNRREVRGSAGGEHRPHVRSGGNSRDREVRHGRRNGGGGNDDRGGNNGRRGRD